MTPESASKPQELARLLLQVLAGLCLLGLVVFVIGRVFGAELDAAGRAFVDRFGYAGVALGVFSSDAFTSPIPPQAYVVAALAGKSSAPLTIGIGCASSVVAGAVGYQIGRVFRRVPRLQQLLDRTRHRVDELFRRWGPWAIVVSVVSPIPYSALCYLCGMAQMPARLFVALLALRVPRFAVTCLVVQWSLGATTTTTREEPGHERSAAVCAPRGATCDVGRRAPRQNPMYAMMSASSASDSTSDENGGMRPE